MNPATTLQANDPYLNFSNSATLPSASTLGNINSDVNSGQSALSQLNAAAAPQTQTQAPAAPKTSIWDRLLPTAGSILGGIGGAALGTVAAPFTAGIVNPFDASVAGAGLGGAAGKAGENALTGKKVVEGSDLTSGLESAAGQAAGFGLGKLAGGLLGGVGSVADKGTVDAIMSQAPGLIDRDTATYLAQNGITDLSKVADIAPQVTGAPGGDGAAFTNALQNTVDNSADKISIRPALENANDPLSASTMSSGTQRNAAAALDQSVNNMVEKSGGDIIKVPQFGASGKPLQGTMQVFQNTDQMDTMSRGAVYDEAKTFQKASAQLAAKAPKDQFGNIADPNTAALIKTYGQWGNDLESHALGLGEGDQPLEVSDDAKAQMKEGISSLQKSNPQLYQTLSDNIDNAGTWKDIRTAQAPLVKANQAYTTISGKLNSVPSTTPLQTATGGKMGVLKSVVSSPTTRKLEAGALSKVSDVASNPALQKAIPVASTVGAETVANSPNDVGGTGATNGTMLSLNQGQTMTPQNSLLGQVLNQDLGAGRAALADPFTAGNYSSQISQLNTLIPLIQKITAAQTQEQNLTSLLNQAGGAQGPIGGILSRLGQTFTGGPASFLGSNIGTQEAATQQALQSAQAAGGQAPSAPMMPEVTQDQTAAQQALTNINNLLNALTVPQAQGATISQIGSQ